MNVTLAVTIIIVAAILAMPFLVGFFKLLRNAVKAIIEYRKEKREKRNG